MRAIKELVDVLKALKVVVSENVTEQKLTNQKLGELIQKTEQFKRSVDMTFEQLANIEAEKLNKTLKDAEAKEETPWDRKY